MPSPIKQIAIGLFFGVVMVAIVFAIGYAGLRKTEIAECYQWQQEAKEYGQFELAMWQFNQCQHYNITVITPKN
jgi:hypothetical protein